MKTTIETQYSAAALLDGGWKPEDKDELMKEYDLSEDEAQELVEEMEELLEERGC